MANPLDDLPPPSAANPLDSLPPPQAARAPLLDRGSFQAAGSLLSGLVAPLGGGLTYLGTLAATGGDTDAAAAVKQATEDRLTYVPTDESGRQSVAKIGAAAAPAANFLRNKADEIGAGAAEQTGSPLIGAAERTGLSALGFALGGGALEREAAADEAKTLERAASVPNAASTLEKRAAAVGETGVIAPPAPPVSPAMQRVQGLQLNVAPSEVNGGIVSRAVESLTNSAKLKRENALANAPKLNDIGASEIGIDPEGRNPGQVITPTDISQAKAPYQATYKSAAKAGDVALQSDDFADVRASGTLKNQQVEDLLNHYRNMPSIDAQDLMTDMADLRAQGSKNIKAPFAPAQNQLGFAQRKVADALEDALGRRLGELQALGESPVSIEDFQAARKGLAKIHSVEDALDDNGNLSAAELHKQLDHNVPLSGPLNDIAQAYGNFRGSLQPVANIKDTGPGMLTPLGAAAAGFAAHGPVGALAGFAGGFAPWVARQAMGSGMVQRSLRNAPGPGMGVTPGYQAALAAVHRARSAAAEEVLTGAAVRRAAHYGQHANDINEQQNRLGGVSGF
jgi:hypothetical protein